MLIEFEILYKETPRAQKYTFVEPDDEDDITQMSWDEWYDTLEEDLENGAEYYAHLCEVLKSAYNEYYLENDSIDEDFAEQEDEDDEEYDDEYDEDEEE